MGPLFSDGDNILYASWFRLADNRTSAHLSTSLEMNRNTALKLVFN